MQAQQLERELFGGADDLVQSLERQARQQPGTILQSGSDDEAPVTTTYLREAYLFGQQPEEQAADPADGASAVPAARTSKAPKAAKRKPAWVDDDDAQLTIDIASANKLRKLRKEEQEVTVDGAILLKQPCSPAWPRLSFVGLSASFSACELLDKGGTSFEGICEGPHYMRPDHMAHAYKSGWCLYSHQPDSNSAGSTLEQRLRGQHRKLHGSAGWAALDAPAVQASDAEPAITDELQLKQFEQSLAALEERR